MLLIFAKQDSFDVAGVSTKLCGKRNTTLKILNAEHGFADCYSENYSETAATLLDKLRKDFLATHTT